ncbi:hypothetical protein COY07_06475 [Candidatus Peregrinibacteria bacterium CG_4_10_14_0_2_um_filter_43_11]|nr:MAG: hypothetical protein COY07_06475 [Candidatus Peregrinibacteria bacterium CG_4_10_14_0_2_um_filter_43_11]
MPFGFTADDLSTISLDNPIEQLALVLNAAPEGTQVGIVRRCLEECLEPHSFDAASDPVMRLACQLLDISPLSDSAENRFCTMVNLFNSNPFRHRFGGLLDGSRTLPEFLARLRLSPNKPSILRKDHAIVFVDLPTPSSQ